MNWREYQKQQRVVEVGDRFISYVDQGQGEPVILLHGIPTWGYLWHGQIPDLATSRRVLVPDLPGFGFSDKRDCFDRSIARQAEYIDAWMDELGIEKAAFVAHDIGGGVALRLATLFPHRVEQLCLLNTVSYDSWPIELMLQAGHPAADRRLSASMAGRLLRAALRQGFEESPDSHIIAGLLAPYRTEVGKLSLIRNASALNTNLTTEITSLLPDLDMPVLLIWGQDDKFQLIKYGQRLAWDIPTSQLVPIAKARHFVMFDQPDQVNRYLSEFMAIRAKGPGEVVHAGPLGGAPFTVHRT